MKKLLPSLATFAAAVLLVGIAPVAHVAAAPAAPTSSNVSWYALQKTCGLGKRVLIHWKAVSGRTTLLHASHTLSGMYADSGYISLKPATTPGKSYAVSVANPNGTVYWGHGNNYYRGSVVPATSWAECKLGV